MRVDILTNPEHAVIDGEITSEGGVVHGPIVSNTIPTEPEHLVNKMYVDSELAAIESAKVDKTNGVMTGALILSGAPTEDLHAANKGYADEFVSSGGYVHPTTDGNLHLPVKTGIDENEVLKAGNQEGVFGWSALTKADVGLENVDNTADAVKSVAYASTASWEGITDKPEAFTPIAHGHDASSINTGVLDISRIPRSVLERLTVVITDAARFALSSSDVQNGDTVKVTSTDRLYLVKDENSLSTEDGYEGYSAGSAGAVSWTAVTDKPSEFTPSAHTHTDIISDALLTARTIAMTGDVNWSVSFNGATDVIAPVTLASTGITAGIVDGPTASSSGYDSYIYGSPVSSNIADYYTSETSISGILIIRQEHQNVFMPFTFAPMPGSITTMGELAQAMTSAIQSAIAPGIEFIWDDVNSRFILHVNLSFASIHIDFLNFVVSGDKRYGTFTVGGGNVYGDYIEIGTASSVTRITFVENTPGLNEFQINTTAPETIMPALLTYLNASTDPNISKFNYYDLVGQSIVMIEKDNTDIHKRIRTTTNSVLADVQISNYIPIPCSSSQPISAGETVKIGPTGLESTYTFVNTAPGANEVLIGADNIESMANLYSVLSNSTDTYTSDFYYYLGHSISLDVSRPTIFAYLKSPITQYGTPCVIASTLTQNNYTASFGGGLSLDVGSNKFGLNGNNGGSISNSVGTSTIDKITQITYDEKGRAIGIGPISDIAVSWSNIKNITPVTVTGSRSNGEALMSLVTGLASLGLVTNNTNSTPIVQTPQFTYPVNNTIDLPYAGFNISITSFAVINGSDTCNYTQYQISTDANFTEPLLLDAVVAGEVIQVNSGALSANTTYYARARYVGQTLGQSAWSPVIVFTTIA